MEIITWKDGVTTWQAWDSIDSQNFQKYLLLPMEGRRDNATWEFTLVWSRGPYWASNTYGWDGYSINILPTTLKPSNNAFRAQAFMVRCIKN